jgi:hypothetical protein
MIEMITGKAILKKKIMKIQVSQNKLSNELKEFSSKMEEGSATLRESYMYVTRAFLEIDKLFWENIKLKIQIEQLKEVKV